MATTSRTDRRRRSAQRPGAKGAARPRALQVLGWAVLALLAYVCIGAQLDYAVERNPALSRLVPPPFRSQALIPEIELALSVNDGERADALGRQLVLARPAGAENFSRLARAAALRQDEADAQAAILASAARGWRDPLAQLVILRSAIAGEEWDVVAQRLTAMRKLRFPREITDEPLQTLSRSAEGRRQLALQLAADELWFGQFVDYGLAVVEPEDFLSIYRQASALAPDSDCAIAATATTRLLKLGEGDEAKSLWSGRCARGTHAADRPGWFNDPVQPGEGKRNPFAWTYSSQDNFGRTFAGEGDERTVSFRNNGRLRRILAQREIVLAPGRHRLAIRAERIGPDDAATAVEMVCLPGNRRITGTEVGPEAWDFVVPAADCGVQTIRVVAEPGKGRINGVSLVD